MFISALLWGAFLYPNLRKEVNFMSKKVFIGIGHGGSDSGAVKYIVEKDYTLMTAKAVADYLGEYSIKYKMSRTKDIDIDMDSKVKMCNDYKPDLVIDRATAFTF